MILSSRNNYQAKWLQVVNEDFVKIVEAEYRCHSDKPFWEYRPTRLFAINLSPETIDIFQKEYKRLEKVFKTNYYKKEVIENIFSNDKKILKLIIRPKELLPGIVFPAVNKTEIDKNYPLVSFSYFSRSFNRLDSDYKNECIRIFEILNAFTNIDYRYKNIYFYPQLSDFQEITGNSYQLGLLMHIWYEGNKNKIQKNAMPSICATGRVSDDGYIFEIDEAPLKLEAANFIGYDFIIFPENNRKDIENQVDRLLNKEKVLFFKHIKDIFNWLNLLTDEKKIISRIINWITNISEKPSYDIFASFFHSNDYKEPLEWKKLIKGNADQKLDKLRVFLEEYCKWANIIPELKFDSLYNKYLDDFIKENDDSDLAEVLRFFRENIKTEGAAMQSIAVDWVKKHNFSVEEASIIYYDKNISEKDQFILEFFRAFCFGEDINAIFQPVVWKSEKFRKLFTTLSIKVLSTNEELLKRYLIEIVSDVDNLILGFTALK